MPAAPLAPIADAVEGACDDGPSEEGGAYAPPGNGKCPVVESVRLVPPALKNVLRALSHRTFHQQGRHRRAFPSQLPAKRTFMEAWADRNCSIEDAKLPRCRPPRASAVLFHLTACFHAGKCLCGDGTGENPDAPIPHAGSIVLGEIFKKGQPGRIVYAAGRAVVCLAQPDESPASGRWYYVGMGNLKDRRYTVKELQHHCAHADGSHDLYAMGSRPASLYAWLELETDEAFDLRLFFWTQKTRRRFWVLLSRIGTYACDQ